MKKARILLAIAITSVLVSCQTTSTVPITGRKQSIIVSDEQMLSLSMQNYQTYMNSATLSTDRTNTAMVKRVGQNLANAVESYLRNNNMSAELPYYKWTFNLVQDKNVNAWCMPGGLIVVYEGLLPVTQNESALAIVLGHEIAHAVAKHSAESLSNAYRQQYGMEALTSLLDKTNMGTKGSNLSQLVMAMGNNLLTSGFSRKQESEADHLGLIFAAMAGYNPQVATTFWQRMYQSSPGSNSLFADHPSNAKRIKDIQTWMPEALKYYKPKTEQKSIVNKMARAGKKKGKKK